MLRKLALTVDYEIFGNGTGDVRQHVTEPTARMATICERHGAPLTIFFEIEEYLAFERHAGELRRDIGYDPALEIRTQIAALFDRGHDVQLHIHPQWVGSRYENKQWRLRPEVQTVDDLFPTQGEVTRYLGERKAAIERILAGCKRPASVSVYRAGAFSAQPGVKLLRGLAANGFVADSSVVIGLEHRNPTLNLDYTRAPARRRCWAVRTDVGVEDTTGDIVEIPIHSIPGRRIHQITPRRMLAKFSRNVPKSKQRETLNQLGVSKNPIQLLRFLWKPVPIKLDFDNLTAGGMRRMIRSAPPAPAGEPDILVLIGHTKEHTVNATFDAFLARTAADPQMKVISASEIAVELRAYRAARGRAE